MNEVRVLPRTLRRPAPPPRGRGAALVVGLLILLVLTIIALGSMRTTLLEERMAGNLRERTRAFESAEAALRVGEAWLLGQASRPIAASGGPVWPLNGPDPDPGNGKPWWFDVPTSWWAANAVATPTLPGLPTPPYYVVEEVQFVPDGGSLNIGQGNQPGRWFYRITARATGADSATEVLLQSTYAVRF